MKNYRMALAFSLQKRTMSGDLRFLLQPSRWSVPAARSRPFGAHVCLSRFFRANVRGFCYNILA